MDCCGSLGQLQHPHTATLLPPQGLHQHKMLRNDFLLTVVVFPPHGAAISCSVSTPSAVYKQRDEEHTQLSLTSELTAPRKALTLQQKHPWVPRNILGGCSFMWANAAAQFLSVKPLPSS